MLTIGFVCPTYQAHELHAYTERAISSFFKTTPNGVVILVDDASPDWDSYKLKLDALCSDLGVSDRLRVIHFESSGKLTRSWNTGLRMATHLKLDYAIAGNNDIVFTPKWYAGLLHALNNGYDLVGPLSNAPGVTAKGVQEIRHYTDKYLLSDNPSTLNKIAEDIYTRHLGKVIETPINGFFQMAKVSSWVAGKYNKSDFYRPVNKFTSKGKVNRTPLMTLNEDELQGRWRKLNMKSAVVCSSYIFHYRAVSRGDRYKKGDAFRIK